MKRAFVIVVGLCMCVLLANAAPKDSTWDGWISDAKCAAKGANSGHAMCAKKCVEGGEKPVLVTDKDQKILNIDNPTAVSGVIGQHVQVSGTMSNGALHVDKVTALQ